MDAMMPQTEFILLVIFLLLALVLLSWEASKNHRDSDNPTEENTIVPTTLGNQE
jgi:preprotein translocase subunit SecG